MCVIYVLAKMLNCRISVGLILIFLTIKEFSSTVIEKPAQVLHFEPTWDSLDRRTQPVWYDQAKVGIFIHWGVYSVPSFGSEWFWTNWRTVQDKRYVEFMQQNYRPGFTYQEFANDFRAELFNATEWASIFELSGARYVVLTSKHHDGYALWPSKYSFGWNSVDIGPHRDIIDELSLAVRALKTRVHFGVYHSLYEWYNPMYIRDRDANFTTNEFVEKKLVELVERYGPEVVWSDGEWEAPYTYWKSTEFLAWLYNESPVGLTVVSNDRWGHDTLCKHGDFYTCSDRYNPGVLQPHKWENAMTLDKLSWGHRTNAKLADYLTSTELISELVVTVSCGGNLLVNVGPNKAGIIEPIFVERLSDMGRWLNLNGEAIYGSVPWKYQNDTVTPGIWYTSSSDGSTVYAMVLNYPYEKQGVSLFSLDEFGNDIDKVTMLGFPSDLGWITDAKKVFVSFPVLEQLVQHGLQLAWTLKIHFK